MSLSSVILETELGATYVFPDVVKAVATNFAESFKPTGNVTLVNVSGACLVLPSRLVVKITVGEEVLWKAASLA